MIASRTPLLTRGAWLARVARTFTVSHNEHQRRDATTRCLLGFASPPADAASYTQLPAPPRTNRQFLHEAPRP